MILRDRYLAIEKQETVILDELLDMKMAISNRIIFPIAVVFFTPLMITYDYAISIIFFFGNLQINSSPLTFFFDIYPFIQILIVFSIPALIVSIFSSWMLRRLTRKQTTTTRVLHAAIVATILWALYLSIWFFAILSLTGRLTIGPFPIPIGPIVAVQSRNSIIRMTEQIDSFELSQQKTSVQT